MKTRKRKEKITGYLSNPQYAPLQTKPGNKNILVMRLVNGNGHQIKILFLAVRKSRSHVQRQRNPWLESLPSLSLHSIF